MSTSGFLPAPAAPALSFAPGAAKTSSDSQVCDAVNRALHARGHPGLWNVCSEVNDGVVHLSGVVRSYYLKQLAQTAVLELEGVSGLHNDLEVV